MTLLNGTAIAQEIREEVRRELEEFISVRGQQLRRPTLATVLVGDDAGSVAYVAMKHRAAAAAGIATRPVTLSGGATQAQIVAEVEALAADRAIDAILVQLPLPVGVDVVRVLDAVPTDKDVDGLSSASLGLLCCGRERDAFVPCTPAGIVRLLERHCSLPTLRGLCATVVSHSAVVGRPLAQLLLNRGVTVSTCHVDTPRDALMRLTSTADIVVTASGVPGLITAEHVREGAVVIDAGYARVDGKVRGDCDFEAVRSKAAWITPPTGGVGPMTIAMLMANTLEAFKRHILADEESLFESP